MGADAAVEYFLLFMQVTIYVASISLLDSPLG